MEKLKNFLLSETMLYLIFGGLAVIVYTTVKAVTWVVFQSGWLTEVFAQVAAILFAFFTNKFFVFRHKSNHVWLDFLNFIGGRLFLLGVSIFCNWWYIDKHPEFLMRLLHISKEINVMIINLALQIIVIVVNYLYSKFFVFKK